ncbi:MAG: methyl-accepting chemotaxis protein, partial [Thauera sp.]|nr:methyl-accepting chemotaxis protein [Thauera sp.]
MRLADMKIWFRLTAAIWLMLVCAWTAVIVWEGQVNRETAIEQAKGFSLSMHEATMAGLTGMMITGTIDQREVFLDQIKQLSMIRDLRVLRSEAVSAVYGPGGAGEADADPLERAVLASGEAHVEVEHDAAGEYLRVVRPTLAQKDYLGKDCLLCHQVAEDTVLGVVSMKVSLDEVNAALATQRIKLWLAAVVVSVPLLGFIFFFISRVVTRPLDAMVSGLRSIASGEGDLTQRLKVRSKDEVGQASEVFNAMMANFATLVAQVSRSATAVAGAADELVTGARQVEQSSQQQDQQSVAASAAVEQMLTSIAEVATSAEQVHRQSQDSLQRSDEGSQRLQGLVSELSRVAAAVNEMADAVNAFVDSTDSITSMTNEVRAIAEQTNLLALNAA